MNTREKWTPGPWSVSKDGRNVCGPVDENNEKANVARYCKRDAHLIAAAPELYGALERAYRKYSDWMLDDDYDATGLLHEIMETFPPVMAKARGESQ